MTRLDDRTPSPRAPRRDRDHDALDRAGRPARRPPRHRRHADLQPGRLLPRAIASLLAQEYANWELLVVDDGSTDDTAAVLDAIDDDRVRSLRGDHGGCCAARNLALDQVKGEVVVYLDDDNVMHPRWLKSVAWAFSQRPDVDVVMGARVIDDVDRVHDWRTAGGGPWIQFEPYDRERLEQGNVADIGVIAHRAGLPEARFDEQLVSYGDWDLFLRLTQDGPARARRHRHRLRHRRHDRLSAGRPHRRPRPGPGQPRAAARSTRG